ncbi:MAG: hypothetical protein JNL67_16530 [Planctomycetaceae bacterium]|nr:hypothetical protein [Planctomycetaceae bacterium]
MAQQTTNENDDWVKHVAPGIRLVGKADFLSLQLPSSPYRAWSPDGKYLLGIEGRRLLEIDWDQRKVTRTVELSIDLTRERVQGLVYSPNGDFKLLLIKETGQSPSTPDLYWDGDDEVLPIDDDSATGNRLLVYDRSGNPIHTWDLSECVADEDYQVFFSHALRDNRTVLILNNQTIMAFDYLAGTVRGIRSNASVFPISEHEVLLSPTLEVWDLRDNSVLGPETIGLPAGLQVRANDVTGNKFLLQDTVRKVAIMWDRKTEKTTTLLQDIESVGGLFSTDGEICFLVVTELPTGQRPFRSKTLVYDINREEIVGHSDFSPGFFRRSIRPAHQSLMVESINDVSLVEVKFDEHFARTMDLALNRLPYRGPISYTDNDQVVAFHANHSFLRNDNEAKLTQRPAYNIDNSVYSPTKPQRIRLGSEYWHDVESGDWSDDNFKVLYKIKPTGALSTMKALLGVQDESQPNIKSVHLGFDPSGQVIRDLYIENDEILRLRFSHSKSGKQISETRLHHEFDKSDRLVGTVSPDGKSVAVVNQEKLTILETKFGEVVREWAVAMQVQSVFFDHSGEYVAIAAGKRARHWTYEVRFDQIQVYRVATGETVWSESKKGITGFGFQPGTDRLFVLTSGEENLLRFFDRDTWQETWRHATSHAPAYGMAMSSTGHEIAIGLRDSRVEFWKLSELKDDSR